MVSQTVTVDMSRAVKCISYVTILMSRVITGPLTHGIGGPVLFCALASGVICRSRVSSVVIVCNTSGAIIRMEAASPAQARR